MLTRVQAKIQDWETASRTLAAWRIGGQRIVFTNGCFDLLHPGHLHYLAEARALGQRLVLGLNSDDSVQRLKGAHRPIVPQADRALLLASLLFVDLVVVFDEDTPLELIQHLQPDVLVKGGDYTIDTIVGAQEVLAGGGAVEVLSFLPGYSTSALEAKIKGVS